MFGDGTNRAILAANHGDIKEIVDRDTLDIELNQAAVGKFIFDQMPWNASPTKTGQGQLFFGGEIGDPPCFAARHDTDIDAGHGPRRIADHNLMVIPNLFQGMVSSRIGDK